MPQDAENGQGTDTDPPLPPAQRPTALGVSAPIRTESAVMRTLRRVLSGIRAVGVAIGISGAGIAIGVLVAALAGMADEGSTARSSDLTALGTDTACLPGIPCLHGGRPATGDDADSVDVGIPQPQPPGEAPPLADVPGHEPVAGPPVAGDPPVPHLPIPGLPHPGPADPLPVPEPEPAPPPAPQPPQGRITYQPGIVGLGSKIIVRNTSGDDLNSWTARFALKSDGVSLSVNDLPKDSAGFYVLSGGGLGKDKSVEFTTGVTVDLGKVIVTSCTVNGQPCG